MNFECHTFTERVETLSKLIESGDNIIVCGDQRSGKTHIIKLLKNLWSDKYGCYDSDILPSLSSNSNRIYAPFECKTILMCRELPNVIDDNTNVVHFIGKYKDGNYV